MDVAKGGEDSGAAFACVAYSLCSVCMVLLNKSLATDAFHVPLSFLMLVQNTACLALIHAFEVLLPESEKSRWNMRLPKLRLSQCALWFPVNLFFCLMLFSGFKTLSLVTVSLVAVCKNVTNVFTTAGDYFMFGQPVSALVLASLALMISAAWLGASSELLHPDQGVNAAAIVWLTVNCASTSAYGLQVKLSQRSTGLTPYGCSYYNALIATPMTLAWTLATGDLAATLGNPGVLRGAFIAKLLISSTLGFGIGFSVFWCISATSPTTYAMVGALNKVPLSVLGVLLFGEPVTLQRTLFVVMGVSAGLLYTRARAQGGATASERVPKSIPLQEPTRCCANGGSKDTPAAAVPERVASPPADDLGDTQYDSS